MSGEPSNTIDTDLANRAVAALTRRRPDGLRHTAAVAVEPSTAVDTGVTDRAAAALTSASPDRGRRFATMVVGIAVSPIVVAALALVGNSWVPMSDWSSMLYRVSQVGTRETPLVGAYSFHGFAHPGPLIYWVAAPLYRLTSGDARSLLWTGAAVNVVTVIALAAVAWRRGRWPLLLGAMALVVLVFHGLEAHVLVDLWNPYVALLPFLLTVFLVWDSGLGRRRAVLAAVVSASFAVQAHLAFLFLTGLLVVWLVVWRHIRSTPTLDGASLDQSVQPGWASLRRPLLVLAGLLWVGPLLDTLFDLHNPFNIAGSASDGPTVGMSGAIAMVGDHIRLNGPWVTGATPLVLPQPSLIAGGAHLAVLLGALAGCLHVGRRRGLVDASALVSLAMALLVGSVPATSLLITPTPSYLTEWIKLVGGLAWFAIAWTGWRLVEPFVRARASRFRAAGALAAALLVTAAGWSWPDAIRVLPPHDDHHEAVLAVRSALGGALARDRIYRVDVAGDPSGHFTGFIYWLIHDGYQVLTADGDDGLKWGHAHRLSRGDRYDSVLTVAVQAAWAPSPAYERCYSDRRVRPIVAYDGLTGEERAWLDDLARRLALDPGSRTQEEARRHAWLTPFDLRVSVFEGPVPCG